MKRGSTSRSVLPDARTAGDRAAPLSAAGDDAAAARTDKVTHRSLERGLAALEIVAGAGAPLSLAEAARRLNLHRSTTHHLMRTLVGLGYLRQDDVTRGYALTPRLHEMTGQKWSVEQLGDIARPILEMLTADTDEGSSVAAWVDGIVTIAAKRETDGPVRVVQSVGAERPIYCTAVGKAIAAWLPEKQVRDILARHPMVAHTAKTITTPEAFMSELRRIRNSGYAIDDAEQHEGLRCIAMPVFCYSGQIIGSMCVVGPRHRMTHQKLQAVRAPLQRYSQQLSERLGYATISRKERA